MDDPISSVHPDILQTHILTRLDGPTLAAAASATSRLHALSSDDSLWRDICHKTWPSSAHPLLRHVIASLSSRHRSFFATSSSTLYPRLPSPPLPRPPRLSPTLISAVDIHYKNNHLLSKVVETGTKSGSWTGSKFLVELFGPTERWPVKLDSNDPFTCESELENNLSLSWILIDPTRARSGNLTNFIPVGVNRNWTTGDVEVRFGTVLSSDREGELVECRVVVTCEGWVKEDLYLKQVRLEIEDLEENKLGWMASLIVLHEALEGGERKRGGERKGYDEFAEMKRKRKERKMWRERWREVVEILTCFVIVLGFWVFVIVPFFLFCFHIFQIDKRQIRPEYDITLILIFTTNVQCIYNSLSGFPFYL